MALQMAITEPNTGASYAGAYGKIDAADIRISPDSLQVALNWYYNQATSRMAPVRPDPVTIPQTLVSTPNAAFVAGLQAALASGAIQSPMDALKASLYFLLTQMPEYAGATQV